MSGGRRPCLLGVDVGTSSTKGVLTSLDGELLATAERQHGVSSPRPGFAEHDADRTWWAEAVEVTRELVGQAPSPVAAVGTSGIGPCVALADAGGRPLRPAILYGIDTRATAEIAELEGRLGAGEVLRRCGSPLTTQATGPKLMWLAGHEAETYRAASKTFMASSYLVWRLTRRYVLDHHSASQSVPLYDRRLGAWAEDWSSEIAPGIELPELVWPADVVGTVSGPAAAETGLDEGTPVCAGTIDAWAESVSVGADRPGFTMLMYGTTMFLVATADVPRSHEALWGTVGVWPGMWCLAGGMSTSGALTAWLRDLVGGPSYGSLVAEAAAVPAGAGGLVILPYFAGERTPLFDPLARGVIAGLTLDHGRAELYRAVLEATAYGVRHNLETMEGAGADLSRLVAVGGGTKGSLWAQVVSDVTGRPQTLRRYSIGAAYGDAFLAGVAAGLVEPGAAWNPTAQVLEPDRATADCYQDLYAVYRSLYPATRDQVHALARVQGATSPGERGQGGDGQAGPRRAV